MRIAYCYCVSNNLVIQNAKVMCLVLTCGMSCSIIFSNLSDTGHEFRKRIIEYKIYVLMFSIIYICQIFHSKKNSARYCHKCTSVLQ